MKLEQLQQAIEVPKAVRDFEPEWGIVLGSGLASVVDEVDAILHLPYEEIRGMPVSRAPGHAGRFIFGQLAGQMMANGAGEQVRNRRRRHRLGRPAVLALLLQHESGSSWSVIGGMAES